MEVKKASTTAIAIMLALLVCADLSEGQVLLDEPVTRLGKGTIGDIAYSPDGRLFAVAGSAGIWLYDAKSLIELGLLQGDTGEVTSIAFSPDGRMIASACGSVYSEQEGRWIVGGTVRLWDTIQKSEIAALEGHAGEVTSVAFSPDGKTLASAGGSLYSEQEGRWIADGTIRLWDSIQKSEIAVLEGHTAPATSVAFSPDGRTLASAGGSLYSQQESRWVADGTIRIWDTIEKSEIAVLEGHTAAATSVVFSPNGRILASAGEDSTVRLWDVDEQKEMAILSHESGGIMQSVAFSPDGNTLAAAEIHHTWGFMSTRGFGTVRLWDMESTSEIAEFGSTSSGVGESAAWVTFSPDGNTLAWANGYGSAVHFWDIAGQEEITTVEGYAGHTYLTGFGAEGEILVSEDPGNIRFWNIAEGKEIGVHKTESVFISALSPDGRIFAVLDGSIGVREHFLYFRLWEVETGTEIASWPAGGVGWFEGAYYEFSPDGNTIAWATVFSTIDRVLYSTSLLNLTEGEMVDIPVWGAAPIAFSPDGKTLALSGDTSIYLWDVKGGMEAEFYCGPVISTWGVKHGGLRNFAFSPDWRYLAAAGLQEWPEQEILIHLWELETKEEVAVFEGEPGDYVELTFSPGGRILASSTWGEDDQLFRMWDIETKEEMEFWDPSDFTWLSPEVEETEFPAGWERIGSSLDGGTLVLEGAEAVSLWDIDGKRTIAVLEDARGPVAFSSDGGLLASGSQSGIILIWDVSPWTGIAPAVVESDGKKALVWGELKSAHGEDMVEQAKLWQNYPNPFNPETWIPFQLAQESEVNLRIYDTKGILIREMSIGKKPAGSYIQKSKAVHWDGRNDSGERVASGVYFYTLQAGDYTETRKMILAE